MKIEAATRLLSTRVVAAADEALARKYIKYYTKVDSDTLKAIDRFTDDEKITFTFKTAEDFNKAIKNLTKHFGKPDTSMSSFKNSLYKWKVDEEKLIMLFDSDLYGNQFVISLLDKRPLSFEEKRRQAIEKNMGNSSPSRQGTPRNSSMGWRSGRR